MYPMSVCECVHMYTKCTLALFFSIFLTLLLCLKSLTYRWTVQQICSNQLSVYYLFKIKFVLCPHVTQIKSRSWKACICIHIHTSLQIHAYTQEKLCLKGNSGLLQPGSYPQKLVGGRYKSRQMNTLVPNRPLRSQNISQNFVLFWVYWRYRILSFIMR